jgi:exodeoxyribonuclease VII large subunit
VTEVRGVKWLSGYLRSKLQDDPTLRTVAIRGAVSNYNTSARGNLMFALSEDTELLQCFAWEDDAVRFPAELKNGAQVVATGRISTYPQRSSYQLVVSSVRLEGVGDVQKIFEELKRRLAAERLFDPARKRPLPAFPFRVALVSSRRADGAIDFVARIRDRRPHVSITWCETSVQGPNAPAEIAGALARASQLDVDMIVVARGGGSFEDLFAFSDERVVRAVVRASHPVLSAVGHTINQQLCDFAADLHAETPSAAAERVGSETQALRQRIHQSGDRMQIAVFNRLEARRGRLERALTRSRLNDSRLFLLPVGQRLAAAVERLERRVGATLQMRRDRLQAASVRLQRGDPTLALARRGERLRLAGARLDLASSEIGTRFRRRFDEARLRLAGNDPEAILQKGYAIVTYDGAAVRDAATVPTGGFIRARVGRGTLGARVESIETDGNERSG